MPVITPFSAPAVGSAGQGAGAVPNRNRATGMDFGDNVNGNGSQAKTINLLDPANSNPLPTSGLAAGGGEAPAGGIFGGAIDQLIGNLAEDAAGLANNISFAGTNKDWRVRVGVNPGSGVLYRGTSPGIMSPLLETDGVIFPFTPTIAMTHSTKYGQNALTHTNYASYFYESSQVDSISVTGEFSVQNSSDASYFMAMIYFFRAAGKMFYGDSGTYQGSPPPILYLNGYGKHYFPNVPCVLTYFNHQLPDNVDYISTRTIVSPGQQRNSNLLGNMLGEGGTTRVPTNSTITVNLQPVYSRKSQTKFDHQKFASGGQLNKGFI